eukprot:3753014-Prymnesium_polylepis.1
MVTGDPRHQHTTPKLGCRVEWTRASRGGGARGAAACSVPNVSCMVDANTRSVPSDPMPRG